jgi:hypothetical protein
MKKNLRNNGGNSHYRAIERARASVPEIAPPKSEQEAVLEAEKLDGRLSPSDRLAVALACATCAWGLMFFWVNKTPLWCGASVAAIFALMVFPIIHFTSTWKARLSVTTLAVFLTGVFAWNVWPKQPSHENVAVKLADTPTIQAPPGNGGVQQTVVDQTTARAKFETAPKRRLVIPVKSPAPAATNSDPTMPTSPPNCSDKSNLRFQGGSVVGETGDAVHSDGPVCLDAKDTTFKGAKDGISIGSPHAPTSPPTTSPAPTVPSPTQASPASISELNPNSPTGISANPNCKNITRYHFYGGEMRGGVSGAQLNNPDVCIEFNGTSVIGGKNGVSVRGRITPIGSSKTIWLAAPSPGDLPVDDPRYKQIMALETKYVAEHPNATPREMTPEINRLLIALGIDAHITWEEPSRY